MAWNRQSKSAAKCVRVFVQREEFIRAAAVRTEARRLLERLRVLQDEMTRLTAELSTTRREAARTRGISGTSRSRDDRSFQLPADKNRA